MHTVTRGEVHCYSSLLVSRRDDYAVQQDDGRYFLQRRPLTSDTLLAHLSGSQTLGTYVIDENGTCRFAVFDCDESDGFPVLARLHRRLKELGVMSYLEASRRGAHLWVFLSSPTSPALLRRWLLPYCPAGVEFYPKQDHLDETTPYGCLIRLPLGVHRLSGRRYTFYRLVDRVWKPVGSTLGETLAWLSTIERVSVPHTAILPTQKPGSPTQGKYLSKKSLPLDHAASKLTIADWCHSQDQYAVIRRYVQLDASGSGCCPFGDHHHAGRDRHPSFFVYVPRSGSLNCWYCHTWQRGGNLFDFLSLYYGLDAHTLWSRIRAGGAF